MANPRDQASLAASAANTVSEFVALEQIRNSSDLHTALFSPSSRATDELEARESSSYGVVVFCASAVLSIAETVFSTVKKLANGE